MVQRTKVRISDLVWITRNMMILWRVANANTSVDNEHDIMPPMMLS